MEERREVSPSKSFAFKPPTVCQAAVSQSRTGFKPSKIGAPPRVCFRRQIKRALLVVIHHAVVRVILQLVELMHWHQLNCIDPQLLQVRQPVDETLVRAGSSGPAGLVLSKPTHVHLVDD